MTPARTRRIAFRLVALAAPFLALVALELGARVLVRVAFDELSRQDLAHVAEMAAQPSEEQYLGHAFLHYVGNHEHASRNALGFVDAEHELTKPEGTVRVGCVGGSTTASGYPALLQDRLREASTPGLDFEVFNFGLQGWTSLHSLVNLAVRGVDYDLDYLVVHHAHNDAVLSNSMCVAADYRHALAPYAYLGPSTLDTWLLGHSQLYRVFWRWRWPAADSAPPTPLARQLLRPEIRPGCGPLQQDDAYDRAPFRRHLGEIVSLARAHGAVVLLTTMPSSEQLRRPEDAPTSIGNEIVREVAARGGTGVLLLDLDREIGPELQPFFEDVVHLVDRGRARKAEAVAAAILAHLTASRSLGSPPPQPPPGIAPMTPKAGRTDHGRDIRRPR